MHRFIIMADYGERDWTNMTEVENQVQAYQYNIFISVLCNFYLKIT